MALLRTFFYLLVLGLSVLMFLGLISNSTSQQLDYFEIHLKRLKALISKMTDELIPLDVHEMKILSWVHNSKKTKKGITNGYLTTIFQEKLFAYAYEDLDDEKIMHVVGNNTDYSFHKQDRNTEVFFQGKRLGTLKEHKGFYELEAGGGNIYKAINAGSHCYSVRKNDDELATVYLGANNDLSNDRFFKMVEDNAALANSNMIAVLLYLILMAE